MMETTATMPDIAAEVTAEDAMQNKYLVFFLDSQEFAIAIEYVTDIINVQPITRVPNVPNFIKGVTNLRGKVIPIIDVRLRFGKEPRDYNDRTCIIVVEVSDVPVGLVIDQVSEVITLSGDEISPPPSFNQSGETRYVQGIGRQAGNPDGSVKMILDCRTILYDEPDEAAAEEAAQ